MYLFTTLFASKKKILFDEVCATTNVVFLKSYVALAVVAWYIICISSAMYVPYTRMIVMKR